MQRDVRSAVPPDSGTSKGIRRDTWGWGEEGWSFRLVHSVWGRLTPEKPETV